MTITLEWTDVAVGGGFSQPRALYLEQNHPNPFNPSTVLSYASPRPGHVQLSIFDVRGRRVTALVAGVQPAGEHSVEWDGRDRQGARVSSGIYLARLVADGDVQTCKVVLAR